MKYNCLILYVLTLFCSFQTIQSYYNEMYPLKILRNIEEQAAEETIFNDEDFTEDILTAFAELYQKVIETSVTYYLVDLNSKEQQESLYVKITKVIVFDLIKIVGLLFGKLIYLIKDPDLSWKEKAQKCWWVIGLIIVIKVGVQKIAYSKPKTSN